MPIEFRCPHCQRLLRVPEGSEGKQAQCPQCQAILQVPAGQAATPPPPGGASAAGNPFGMAQLGPAPGATSENPYQAPTAAWSTPRADAGPGVTPIVPTRMDLGDVMGRTWEIYKSNLGMVVLVVFVVLILNYAVSFITGMLTNVLQLAAGDPVLIVLVQFGASLVQFVFQIWIGLGQFRFMLNTSRGQRAEFTDVFTGGPYLVRAILGGLLIGLLASGLALIFLGPGGLVYLATKNQEATIAALVIGGIILVPVMYFIILSTFQYQALIIDRDMDVMESLRTSWTVMSGNRLSLFALMLLVFLAWIVGCVACLVPGLFVMAYFHLAQAVVYLVVTGQQTADRTAAPLA